MKRNTFTFTAFVAALALMVPAWTGAQDQDAREKAAEHTVIKGDTLWDISAEYLKDPFLWPEVWKLNPGIQNPDLIYPGEMVKLPGLAGEAGKPAAEAGKPAAAEAGAAVPGKKAVAPTAKAKARKGGSPFGEAPLVDIGETLLLVPEEKEDRVISLDVTKKPRIPVASQGAILESGFISDDLDDTLEILGSTKGKRNLYSLGDELLIDMSPDLKPGDLLVAMRSEGAVEHPATGDDLGGLMRVSGLLRVQGEKDGFLLCNVIRTINEIRPTDLLLPYDPPEPVYEPVPKKPGLRGEWGYVVVAQEFREVSGMLYTVYLDLGSEDGVSPGDSFVVRRSGGAIPAVSEVEVITSLVSKLDISSRALPDVEVGTVQVISVQDYTSTAKVVKFNEPLRPGYRVYYED